MTMIPKGRLAMSKQAQLLTGAIGYVFRIEAANAAWAYIGQSTRLDQVHVNGYLGSGAFMKQVIGEHGTDGLSKRILATAETQLELHYLEMLHIAEARRDGMRLGNGDFGGPRPFPNMQQALWNVAPSVMRAASDPTRFYEALVKNRDLVEQAIVEASDVPVDEFYAGLERDLRAIEDLSHPCPSCGSGIGAVCRTNASSLTLPRNPARNHVKRPRA